MAAGLPSTANLQFKTFDQLVADFENRWGGATGTTPNLKSGSVALALFQTYATQIVYFEFLLQAVIAMARLSTASGSDVDSFVNDFGMTRLAATFATGPVTLSVLSPAVQQATIPVGTIIQSQGGVYQYQLIADTNQPAYNESLNAYVLEATQTSITATAQAVFAGASQNVQANILTQLGQAGSGIDTVTNSAPIINGKDPETDAQVKARFVQFIAALSKATQAAILFAVNSVQQGLDVNLLDNMNSAAEEQPGMFTVVVEDGSGTLSAALESAIYAAVDAVRAFTIQFTVIPPTLVDPTIALNIRVAPSGNVTAVIQNVTTAILDYVNSLTIGEELYLLRLVQVAEDADPNVVSVQPGSVLIDGEAQDLGITPVQLVRVTSGNITVATY